MLTDLGPLLAPEPTWPGHLRAEVHSTLQFDPKWHLFAQVTLNLTWGGEDPAPARPPLPAPAQLSPRRRPDHQLRFDVPPLDRQVTPDQALSPLFAPLLTLRDEESRQITPLRWYAACSPDHCEAQAQGLTALLHVRTEALRAPLAAFAQATAPEGPLTPRGAAERAFLLRDAALIWILHGRFDPPDLRAPLRWAARPAL